MGSCCCKEDDDSQYEDEANERTRLLADPVRRRNGDASTSDSNEPGAKAGTSLQKNDEHRALSDILDQTVRNIIDVSQTGNTFAEHHDYYERSKKYADNLQSNPNVRDKPRSLTMKDVANVERMLSVQPLSAAEYATMVRASAACNSAIQNMSVQPRDDLLVTFAINT